MNDTLYVHTFRTSEQCYVYDVNTAKILNVPESVYDYLSNPDDSKLDESTIVFIDNMKENGFLRSDRVEISEHPATSLLPYYLQNKMRQLILQVTQSCNLRCSYCMYSGSYKQRLHSGSSMSIEVAERAIDFFIKRTKDNKRISLSFFGGEPLLNLSLIKHCVNYIEAKYCGDKLDYSMTTNGTLLDDSSISYLAEKEFKILISLDGPEEIHDSRRRFASNGKGTFSTIMHNVSRIKELYPDYYHNNISFNAIANTEQSFCCVDEFITKAELFDAKKFMLNYTTDNYTDNNIDVIEKYSTEREYEYFKLLLSKLGELSYDKVSHLLSTRFFEMYKRCFQNIGIDQDCIPPKFHHSGPCIPGVNRLFVDTSGRFFPCERVSELSETVILGDIENGIALEKISQILNVEAVTHSSCRNCWAYRHCSICAANIDDMHCISDIEAKKRCPSVRNTIETMFKDYCVLRELGYMFDEERFVIG